MKVEVSREKLEKAILDANDALFESSHFCDEEQIEHEINCHPYKLPQILRSVAKRQREAMLALQEVIQEMVGG